MMTERYAGAVEYSSSREQKWQYTVVSLHARRNDVLEEALNTHGKQGWELVFMHVPLAYEYCCVFRRQIHDA